MAKSVAQMKQERDQQASLLRSLPNDKDEAAQTVRKRIAQLDRQIATAEGPAQPTKSGSGTPWLAVILLALILLVGLAFLGVEPKMKGVKT